MRVSVRFQPCPQETLGLQPQQSHKHGWRKQGFFGNTVMENVRECHKSTVDIIHYLLSHQHVSIIETVFIPGPALSISSKNQSDQANSL